jgi:hypothetical protein
MIIVATGGIQEVWKAKETLTGIGNPQSQRYNVSTLPSKAISKVTITLRSSPNVSERSRITSKEAKRTKRNQIWLGKRNLPQISLV